MNCRQSEKDNAINTVKNDKNKLVVNKWQKEFSYVTHMKAGKVKLTDDDFKFAD